MDCPVTDTSTLVERRARFSRLFDGAALFAAGRAPSRNFPDNVFPFRASSHFLYFAGRPLEGAALLYDGGRWLLLAEPPDADDALWHGPSPSLDDLKRALAVDEARPIARAPELVADAASPVATLAPQDAATTGWLAELLGRGVSGGELSEPDARLADALIALRLVHDQAARDQLRFAAAASAEAHLAGMRATRPGASEQRIYAAMIDVLRRHALDDAYGPIVTVHGEVLHQRRHDGPVQAGDLLLADVGGETPEGWAADITRTWPVSGAYSPTQRALYEVVFEAQRRCIEAARPGQRYRAIHETAKRTLVEGLVALGIYRGDVDGLLERGAAALFFPHGVGHIIGLDVHDMEDLGDRAGYAPGRKRSDAFGDAFLRLDRDLEPGMAVTIEPGFYQVPAILDDPKHTEPLGDDLRRDELSKYADVRGIRIEDDVLITEDGHEVLSAAVPKAPDEVEAAMRG